MCVSHPWGESEVTPLQHVGFHQCKSDTPVCGILFCSLYRQKSGGRAALETKESPRARKTGSGLLSPVLTIRIAPEPQVLCPVDLAVSGISISLCLVAGKELEVGMCEITALNRDISHPRRMIARQTARCACRRGQVAGTTRAKPACVDAQLIGSKQWCGMEPCDEGEQCSLLINRSGWSCTRQLGRIKTVTVRISASLQPTRLRMGEGTGRGGLI
uniref:TAFA chemokine like family member 5 n=1 Tax=Pelusios castaneus TaxID=367368 RepID=A0A8C8S514_9SAUR